MHLGQLTTQRLNEIFEKGKDLDFPQLLVALRKAYGITRRRACEELKLSYMRLFTLEKGYFTRVPRKEEMQSISDFYGVAIEHINTSLVAFLAAGKGQSITQVYRKY
jgi:transcriptional regulator with XRE-family HTH domain